MIRVRKPQKPPEILATSGVEETKKLRKAPAAHRTTFIADKSIYGHESVKEALKTAQHDKCCFCESKISHISYGHVEHFRPKKGYCQAHGDPLIQPGYYWLTYDWRNLFLCCELCNSRFKGNLFPLIDPKRRAKSHRSNIRRERPLFIDPGQDEPARYISFREETAFAIDDNPRGQATIDALGLNRPKLKEMRLEWLTLFKFALQGLQEKRATLAKILAASATLTPEDIQEMKEVIAEMDDRLRRYRDAPAQYAGMIRALLATAKSS